jgi:hypothetical protein
LWSAIQHMQESKKSGIIYAYLFLPTSPAQYINGGVIRMDGGFTNTNNKYERQT